MQLMIQPLTEDDYQGAIALWQAVGLTRPWNDPMTDLRLAMNSPASTILAGKTDGRLVATAMTGTDGHRGWVYYLAVAEELRGRGYGREMMRACETWVAAKGVRKMNLMIRSENTQTAQFYRAIGYDGADVRVLSRWVGQED
jgi:ribosomal protein S18 acetylase RimI-like enzyme